MRRRLLALGVLAAALAAAPVHADSVTRTGGVGDSPLDAEVVRSRERLAAGDADEALRLARVAVSHDPRSVPALQSLAAAQLALGDAVAARQNAEAAVALAPGSAALHELLGDALAELADFSSARAHYRAALEIAPQSRLQAKLDGVVGFGTAASSARLRLQYDGGADQPLGLAVLRVLDGAWQEYRTRLGFSPAQPVTVVLQTATAFRDTTRAPEWAAAWNDGTIRVPVAGLTTPSAGLVRVLRHELAHSFVVARAGANCPTWLQEGIAQWLEGGDPGREDAVLAREVRRRSLDRLESLETPFVGLTHADATRAYAISLSAVAHILRRRGEAGVRQLLDALAAGHPAAQALPIALSMSYGDLQRDWQSHLADVATAAPRPR